MRRMHLLLSLLVLSILLIAGLAITSPSNAQNGSTPDAAPQPLEEVEIVVMPPVDVKALLAEDELRAAQGLPPRFAQPIPVDITPFNHGTWETLPNGTSLWRLRILSTDALSLNLGFTRYSMPAGGTLLLYSPDGSQTIGPFTEADNEEHGQLWSPILTGDEIVIEVSLPTARIGDLDLALTSVNHGYIGFGEARAITSGSCNLDVVCSAADGYPQVDSWRDPIRSVAVISTGGSTFCTGFLVNNTAQDLKGYFMTADHCGIDPGSAPSLVTYWNYENSWCRPVGDPINGQPGDGLLNQYNTGSYFRASYSSSDFTLVELDDPINPAFNVHWAGWDRSGADSANATAIHHPNTDEKRISFEDQATTVTSYLGTSVPGDGTHVRVADWDLGTTEPGSSGSPLFDANYRIIGQLHGGYAACGNDLSDWYGRFYTSWTGGGNPNSRLSDWLDPINTGQQFLDGRDLVETPFVLEVDPMVVNVCAPDPATYGITVTQETPGYFNPVTLSVNEVPSGALALFSTNPVIPTYTSTLTITQTELALPGSYNMDLVGIETTHTFTSHITLNLFNAIPAETTLLTPANGAADQPLRPVFAWEGSPNSNEYTFRIDKSPLFTLPTIVEGLTDPTYSPPVQLDGGACYWWSVQTENTCGAGEWTEPFHFSTVSLGVSFFDDIESGPGLWTHAAAQGVDNWAISTAQSHSPSHAWFVPDDPNITDTRLWTTAPISLGAGSTLTFWHRYQFEGSSWDGSVLEISTNGGATWTDLGEHITANGYNGTISSNYSNPLGGRQGWVGDLTTWTEVSVNLNNYAGQQALIRWRLGCDSSISDVGWFIDDVQITSPLPPNPAPALSSITPDNGDSSVPTPVIIMGTNFTGSPALRLGDTWLEEVVVLAPDTISAVVPAGMPDGVYDLDLFNGDCQPAVLVDAFTVTSVPIPISGLAAVNNSPNIIGVTTSFTATVETGNGISYDWDFGDGSFGNGRTPVHLYAEVGIYTAIVTATNVLNSETTTTTVTIVDVPIAGLAAVNDSPTDLGYPTTFTATVELGTNVVYTWDFGDGSTATGQVVAHEYALGGIYTATVTASNTSGSVMATTEVTIVAPPVIIRFIYLPLTLR